MQDLDCLQQAVADQAFTNAKAAGDTDGMVNALIFRALERNTAAVGQASTLCTETAKNPEIAAIQQHQDELQQALAQERSAREAALEQMDAALRQMEIERQAKEAERQAKEAAQQAKETAQQAHEAEREAKEAALAEVARLQALLRAVQPQRDA